MTKNKSNINNDNSNKFSIKFARITAVNGTNFTDDTSVYNTVNTLTANDEVTRRLRSLLACQTTSYLVLTNVKYS